MVFLLLVLLIGLCSAANRPACTEVGGECHEKGTDCDGERLVGKKYCTSKKEFCCVPPSRPSASECPVDEEGYFIYLPSAQCFKFFANETANYDDGKAKCENEGMSLAHPYDSWGLRSYMIQRWGHAEPYLDASFKNGPEGEHFYWNDNDVLVPNTFWLNGEPNRKGDDYCMILLVWDLDMEEFPLQPFYARPCSDENYTLCELKP